ncbi:MAG: DinB family protein [Candidatus Delongbacteria bacterium]
MQAGIHGRELPRCRSRTCAGGPPDPLENLARAFEVAGVRLEGLRAGTDDAAWCAAPGPGRWSAAQCLAHLVLTSEALLPGLRRGLEQARELGLTEDRPRQDLWGWLLAKGSGPGARWKIRTPPAFDPPPVLEVAPLLERFLDLQRDQAQLARAARDLPLTRVKIPSPFQPRIRYNLFSALVLLAVHQERHLAQVERALNGK